MDLMCVWYSIYEPVDYRFFGIEATVSGVGYDITKALKIPYFS